MPAVEAEAEAAEAEAAVTCGNSHSSCCSTVAVVSAPPQGNGHARSSQTKITESQEHFINVQQNLETLNHDPSVEY